MSAGRVISLIVAVVLAIGLAANTMSNAAQPVPGTAHLVLSAPNPADCSLCKDCAKPCVATVVCSTTCLSLGLASGVQGAISHDYSQRRTPETGSQPSSADLLTPTPPPKPIRIA